MPTDVSAIVHPSQQKAFRVIEFRQFAWQSDGARVVDTCWDLIVQGLMGTLIVEHVPPQDFDPWCSCCGVAIEARPHRDGPMDDGAGEASAA
jgi:hypothetical protein